MLIKIVKKWSFPGFQSKYQAHCSFLLSIACQALSCIFQCITTQITRTKTFKFISKWRLSLFSAFFTFLWTHFLALTCLLYSYASAYCYCPLSFWQSSPDEIQFFSCIFLFNKNIDISLVFSLFLSLSPSLCN